MRNELIEKNDFEEVWNELHSAVEIWRARALLQHERMSEIRRIRRPHPRDRRCVPRRTRRAADAGEISIRKSSLDELSALAAAECRGDKNYAGARKKDSGAYIMRARFLFARETHTTLDKQKTTPRTHARANIPYAVAEKFLIPKMCNKAAQKHAEKNNTTQHINK